MKILTTIFIIIGFGLTIFQTFCYKIKQQQEYFDSNIFNRSIIYLLSNISNALFSVIIVIICYIFIIYKTQEIVKILLPIHERVILQIYLYIAILLKFIKILHDIWIQSNIDIFFIDWERPKIAENQINLRTNLDTPSISSGGKNLIYEGISAWRNYFIANEWLKLTIQRKFSMFMQIILVSVIVISWNPKNNGNNVETDDPILNLAIGIIIYTLTYVILRLFNNLIYERFIKNSIHQFIDICSLGNISVFILSQQCYGYYVHGRSPHGFSDTDMCSMLLQLKREENNMSGQRGLIPNSVQQTYTFLAPINLRLLYDKLIIPFQQQLKCTTDNNHQQIIDFHNNSKYYGSKLDKIASTYYNINRFLCAFIDHGLKDLNYIIQDRSFIEIILNFVFGQNVTDNCGIFYTDSGHSFDKVLFYVMSTAVIICNCTQKVILRINNSIRGHKQFINIMASNEFTNNGKKILGAALNYSDILNDPKVKKPDSPVLFLKPSSSYIVEGQDIIIPKVLTNVLHEVELGVIIGKTCKNVSINEAMNFVGGYCLGLDLSAACELGPARQQGFPWSMGKGFDTATPVSRFIHLHEILNPHNVQLWCNVNGISKQNGNTKDLIYNIPALIAYASKYMTLEVNDLILTGTPKGAGPIVNGDIIECGLNDFIKIKFNVKTE